MNWFQSVFHELSGWLVALVIFLAIISFLITTIAGGLASIRFDNQTHGPSDPNESDLDYFLFSAVAWIVFTGLFAYAFMPVPNDGTALDWEAIGIDAIFPLFLAGPLIGAIAYGFSSGK